MNEKNDIETTKELEKKSNNGFRLPISIHTVLYIEAAGAKSNIKCELVGLKHQSYLIADLQDSIDAEFVDKNNLKPGVYIACRYIYEGAVYGFKSYLMAVFTTPIKLMAIQYPSEVEECNRRSVNRTRFVLPSTIIFEQKTYPGSIIDISERGCQLAILKTNIDENGLEILSAPNAKDAYIILRLPGAETEIKVPVVSRNTRDDAGKLCFGLEFNNLDSATRNIISAFVEEMRSYLLT